jgi:hypothetical protein
MHRGEGKLRALACVLMGVLGCARSDAAPAPAPRQPETTHYLDEPFALAGATCRLLAAEPALTEPARTDAGRVAEDLHVVDTSFSCEDGKGALVALGKLAGEVRWVDEAAEVHLPSTRTKLGQRLRDHLIFEVPRGLDGLLRTRTYDARTGEPEGTRERRAARLLIVPPTATAEQSAPERTSDKSSLAANGGQAPITIAPWPRLHDRALDGFLDRLAHTLATQAPFETLSKSVEGHEAIAAATELYQRALSRLAPKLLVVRAIENREGQPRLTLRLESGPGDAPLLSFEFELTLSRGEPAIVRLIDLEASRRDLSCAVDESELSARAERVRSERKAAQFCNALGVLLPGPCAQVDPALLADALRVRTRCGRDGKLDLDVNEALAAPSDFEVKLRRGRSQGSLDSAPRYAVTLARSGQVHFEGQQWVTARGTHEGRTSEALLSALSGLVARLGWFERMPGEGTRCANDERGDLIGIRAGGRERTLRDREGCRGGFTAQELSVVRRAIERVGAVDVWTAPSFSPLERDAEIWVVAAE